MASTAPSTLDQAVMTTTGSVASRRCKRAEEVDALLARGGVARVVEVHEHGVDVLPVDDGEHARRRGGGDDVEAFALEQQAKRLEDVDLVVGDEDARAHGPYS